MSAQQQQPQLPRSKPTLPLSPPTRAPVSPSTGASHQRNSSLPSSMPAPSASASANGSHSRAGSNSMSAALLAAPDAGVVITGDVARPVNLRDPSELIERATAPELQGAPDWGLNLRTVDLINGAPGKAEYLIDALMTRVTHSDARIGASALTLLEALVKNCRSTHAVMNARARLDAVVSVLPRAVREGAVKPAESGIDAANVERCERALLVLQSWGKAFAWDDKYPNFMAVYKELQAAGVQFAEPDKDEKAPVHTPMPNAKLIADRVAGIASLVAQKSAQRTFAGAPGKASTSPATVSQQLPIVASSQPSPSSFNSSHASASSLPSSSANRPSQASSSSSSSSSSSTLLDPPVIFVVEPSLSDEQLRSCFASVQLLLELLDASEGARQVSSDEVIAQLRGELRRVQASIVKKLQNPSGEDRIAQLLAMMDVLTNTLAYYDGLASGRMRKRDDRDQARLLALAADHANAQQQQRPTIRRASSWNQQDHEIRLVKEKETTHQYEATAQHNQTAFSYGVAAAATSDPRRSTWHPSTQPPAQSSSQSPSLSALIKQQARETSNDPKPSPLTTSAFRSMSIATPSLPSALPISRPVPSMQPSSASAQSAIAQQSASTQQFSAARASPVRQQGEPSQGREEKKDEVGEVDDDEEEDEKAPPPPRFNPKPYGS